MFPARAALALIYGCLALAPTGPVSLAQAGPGSSGSPAPAANVQSKLPVYDVVTIRPNKEGPGSTRVSTNLDMYNATNVSLIDLLNSAYNLRPGMLSGEPGWADSARFDIHAKILDMEAADLKKLTADDRQRMMRDLLASRFGVQAHRETKTLPVYELVQAKSGAKLQPLALDDKSTTFRGVSSGGTSIHGNARGLELTAHSSSMSRFAETMSVQVNRPVVDKTGMPGQFDFHLQWSREDAPAAEEGNAPPLFTALEEQLGLKLVSTKAPVETLVVDRATLPSADEN